MLSQNAFGLVDALWVDDLPDGVVTTTLAPAELAASAHLMPRLVDLRKLPKERAAALLECLFNAHKVGQPPPMPILVKTGVNADQFARQWNALQLAVPQPGRKVWLRLHDPRVFHQLLRIATPFQRSTLFSRRESFSYWIGEQWVTVRPDGNHSSPQYTGILRWDWPRIERIGIVNRALDAAGVHLAEALTRQGAVAEQLIERALTRHGIVDRDDLVEFAARGIATRSTFDEHPLLAGLIKPRSDPADESSLAHRLATIDEHIWNELRQSETM